MSFFNGLHKLFESEKCTIHPDGVFLFRMGCHLCHQEAFTAARKAEYERRVAIVEEGTYRAAKRLREEGL